MIGPNSESRSNVIQSQSNITSKAQRNATEQDDPSSSEPIEGGPKTAEVAPEPTTTADFTSSVHISPDLTEDQRRGLVAVLEENRLAFGLDGRLGNHDAHVRIPMKPHAIPVSLPPFAASPTNREVIDKQMDSWIQLGVIEPSTSPWAAATFITYRNGK
ncbi:hypothetical protein BDZ89DRAFT_950981, partial [Hymenopellis radicata]